mmetsp:Transcript_35650/g.81721  ORF Transcript_35650/g.81721 Transcript_35650/m.81721 type:complete len:213 (-) Transcript_35650:27-665(-)
MVHGQLKLHHTALSQPNGDVSPTHAFRGACTAGFSIPVGVNVEEHTDEISVSLCTPWRCMPSSCIGANESDAQATAPPSHVASGVLEGVSVPVVRDAERRPQSISIESSTTAETGEHRHSLATSPSSSSRQDLDWAPEQDEILLPVQSSQGWVKENFLKELPRAKARPPKRSAVMAYQGPPRSPGLPPAVCDWEARLQGNRELTADWQVSVL